MKATAFSKQRGFTLIELLIVIAIISILAGAIFVALDPLTRFQDARDARRASDTDEIASAIKINQIDNGGEYLTDIEDMGFGDVKMIVNGDMNDGCNDNDTYCETSVGGDSDCVDLSLLVDQGYLGDIPVSPSSGNVEWDSGEDDGDEGTGYTLEKEVEGHIIVRACEAENTDEIQTAR